MNKFWALEEPDGADADRRRSVWNKSDAVRYEIIECPLDPPRHRRAGDRLSLVNVILPNLEPYDFVWAPWACLVQQSAFSLINSAGFRGQDFAPATVTYANSTRNGPKYWQLLAKGSAGGPGKASGVVVRSVCAGCKLTDYSKVEYPSKFIDESQWDGSDFFHVEPFPSWIFVTDRVVRFLRKNNLTGWQAKSLEEMKEMFDIALPDSD